MAGKLNKQELGIAALLTEPTIEAAAAKAGVSYRTMKGWLARPDFAARYRAARTEVLERAIAQLLQACTRAVGRLEKNLDSESVQGSNRAAELILAHTAKGIETLDLRAEVDELKRQLAALRKGSDGHDGATGPCEAEGGGR
jgi:hypothetical protein